MLTNYFKGYIIYIVNRKEVIKMYFYPKGAIEITETEVLEKIYDTIETEVFYTICGKVREETIRFIENKGLDTHIKNASEFEGFLENICDDFLYEFAKNYR